VRRKRSHGRSKAPFVDGLDVIARKTAEHSIQRLFVIAEPRNMQQLELEHSRRSSIHDPVAVRNAFGPAFEEEHAERGDVLHIFLNFSKVADASGPVSRMQDSSS